MADVLGCAVCGDELPKGDYASCKGVGERDAPGSPRCLSCCTDFAGHCSDVQKYNDEMAAWLAEVQAQADREMNVEG